MKNGHTMHEVSEDTVWVILTCAMQSLRHSDGYSIKIGLS
jgi:hypothetical protein